MKRLLIHTLLVSLITWCATASSAMAEAIGTWRLYQSFAEITDIQPAGRDIFVLASTNLYSYNVNDNSLTTYDRTTCLTGSEITNIAWSKAAKSLIVAYADSNIDLLTPNQEVTSISDIANKVMTGSKSINDIYVKDKYAYVSTGFGIVKLNVVDAYIADSYILGYGINYCYIDGNYIYGASESQGLMRAALTDNLLDKSVWVRVDKYKAKDVTTYFEDTYNHCYWGADENGKLAKFEKDEKGEMKQMVEFSPVQPDGPASNCSYRLGIANDRIVIAAGGWSEMTSNLAHRGQVMELKNDTWREYDYEGEIVTSGGRYTDVNYAALDPRDPNHAFSCGYNGLFEFYNGKFKRRYGIADGLRTYDNATKDYHVIVTDMKFDKTGNLWFMNAMTEYPLWCITASGELKNLAMDYHISDNDKSYDIEGVTVDGGAVWFVNNRLRKSVLYKYDIATDKLTSYENFVTEDGVSLSPDNAYVSAVDKRGNVWVGTDKGPVYLKPENQQSHVFTQHKVPRNDGTNYADYLLENIHVTTIAVDAQNRKWIGTKNNGIYLISDDCNTQVYHFTKDNSPLPSDFIYHIAVDDTSGRVYFATEKGACSFLADVTENSGDMTEENIWAYPNPVTPEHTGMITIVGLAPGAQLHITTSSGQLVHQAISSGGSYQWNGCDMKGRSVASGVYMVNITTPAGEKCGVTKIAIVR